MIQQHKKTKKWNIHNIPQTPPIGPYETKQEAQQAQTTLYSNTNKPPKTILNKIILISKITYETS